VVIRLLLRQMMTHDSAWLSARTAPLIAASAAMRELRKEAELAARLDLRVLIAGEYGVGKRRLAKLIHAESSRRRRPFLQVRCAQEPEPQLYTRLFGTGDSRSPRPGAFERAHGGTILLQDVDSLTPALQDSLNHFLAERSGNASGTSIDVQILASTKQPLIDLVAAGTFRRDLYYRLNTIFLPIPPLRERPEDVEPLFQYFTSYYARHYRVGSRRLKSEWQAHYQAQNWPGNVRGLQAAAAAFVAQTAESIG
jgi:DNA-binding NtrC family response regulator